VKSEATSGDPVARLRQALNEDGFILYCQPVAALGGLVMANPMGEVLIRLREEEEAMLPPGEFLPVLEDHGLMPELDRWVVRQVLRRVAIGSRIARFCINLSAQTVVDRGFPGFVGDELSAALVPGNCLLFEIEEADAMAIPEGMARFAALAGSLGAGIVIDGFGRTPDALQLLVDVPCLQVVKLHASMTRRALSEGKADPLLDRILRETSARKIGVVAECVEDLEALPRLRALGIRYVQGFGVHKPRPIDDFVQQYALLVA
jgi:EAL domain-containing protein (putative c-di-GMP-specific phosphodiesterase class I)